MGFQGASSHGSTVVSGTAHVHQGDSYVYNHYQWDLQLNKYKRLLGRSSRVYHGTLASDGSDIQQTWSAAVDFRLETCHAVVAEDSLEYIQDVCKKAPVNSEILKRPSAKYSAKYWEHHIRTARQTSDSSSINLAKQLLTNKQINLLTWVQVHNINDEQDPDQTLVRAIVSLGVDVNVQGGFYENALFPASNKGYEQVVEILLDNGANVNAQGADGETALYAASIHGHAKVVEILIAKGADVNAQGGEFNTVLQAVSAAGDEKVVQILPHKGADVNAQRGYYGNALSTAAAQGNKQVVKRLLTAMIPTLQENNDVEQLSSTFLGAGWAVLPKTWSKFDEDSLRCGIERLGPAEVEFFREKPLIREILD